MNIQQIDYVLAVYQCGNFSVAANKCHVTQSTLSTMIAKFEEEIGFTVFDRKTKPVSITKEGIHIIEQLTIIAKEVDVLKEMTKSLKGELTGQISMGILPTIAPYILPEFLNDFAEKYPHIAFSVSEMTTNAITEQLLKRELDIGIIAIPIHRPELIEYPLYNESFVLYDCSGDEAQQSVQLNNIDFSKFWLLEEGHCLSAQVKSICDIQVDGKRVGINFDFKAGSIDSLIRFVKINKGITMLPYLASLEFNSQEHKKVRYFEEPIPARTIGIVVHKHFAKKQIITLLQQEIMQKINPLLIQQGELKTISPL